MMEFNNTHNYEYNLYLCNIDKSIICALDYIDIQYEENFLTYDTLSFAVPLTDNGWRQVKNKYFNYLQPLYLILMECVNNDKIIKREHFIVNSPSFSYDNGVTKKNIKCYSSDYELNNRYLNAYTAVKVLYDKDNSYGGDGILNTMLNAMDNTWSVKYLSSSLTGVYHSFDYSSATYRSVIEDLMQQYNCYFIFDTITNEISIYTPEEYGEKTDIVISDENYLRTLSCDIKNSEMVTSLRVYGKDNLTCVKYNPRGTIDIRDYSWFYDSGRMSTSLGTAYVNWKNLISTNETTFQGYLVQWETLNTTLNTATNQLKTLKEQLAVIADDMDKQKVNSNSTTSIYSELLSQYNTKNSEITTKQTQINGYNSQISTIQANITALNQLLSITNNFTLAQRQELSKMTIEAKLTLDSVDDAKLLYEYSKEYIKLKNKPTMDIQLDVVDLFSIQDSFIANRYDKIKVGNFLYLDCSSLGFNFDQYRITQITHKKLSNSLSITISNKDRVNSELNYLSRIFKKSSTAAETLETNKSSYSEYTQNKDNLINKGDTITNPIENGSNIFDQRGFTGRDIGSNGSIQLKNDKIIISKDGWSTYHTLLSGNGLYLEKNDKMARIIINPEYGIQIDRNVGTVSNPIWENVMYIDNDGNITVSGIITSSEITSSEINNGNGTFRVTPQGVLYASQANITGNITGSTFDNNNGTFKVDLDGRVTASNINITGGSINVRDTVYVGDKIQMNPSSFSAEINFGNVVTITSDPVIGSLTFTAPGGVWANGVRLD